MFRDQVRRHPEWLEPWRELMLISMRSIERRLPMPSVWKDAEWGALSVPALFLVGEHETIYGANKAVRLLKRVAPQVTAEIIPGAGHDLTMAQADSVDSRIIEFLKGKVAASGTSGTLAS
jgi:pimeloyl-ACP methyl ester carboxylesterase